MYLGVAVVTRKELLSGRWHREKGSSVYKLTELEQLTEQELSKAALHWKPCSAKNGIGS